MIITKKLTLSTNEIVKLKGIAKTSSKFLHNELN